MSRDPLSEFREFVERWAEIVSQIESGYVLSYDDYLNDIDLRRIIDERRRLVSDAVASDVMEQLSRSLVDSDDRFRNATVDVQRNIWGKAVEREEGWGPGREWYYYRVPPGHPDWM